MVKKPDIKTRKKLRITMCVLYLMELVICTMPFIQDTKVNADGLVTVASPFNMFMMLFGGNSFSSSLSDFRQSLTTRLESSVS